MTTRSADVIAIDGPGGAGKGTAASLVAARLGWRLLDSGALYRVVGLAALRRDISLADAEALAALTGGLDIHFADGGVRVDGVDESLAIRQPEVDAAASKVAALAPVRAALLTLQRGFRRAPGLVADGRDMGTVVFPDAPLKVFLTASAEERARRRYRQRHHPDATAGGNGELLNPPPNVRLRALLEAIEERDRRDRQRAVSPLVAAPDAVTIDSTKLSIEVVVATILAQAERRGLGR